MANLEQLHAKVVSRFLNLPLEIRFHVYRYVFRGSLSIMKHRPGAECGNVRWDLEGTQDHILRTCRQVYVEAERIFYESNLWQFGGCLGSSHLNTKLFLAQRLANKQISWIKHTRLARLRDLHELYCQPLLSLESVDVVYSAEDSCYGEEHCKLGHTLHMFDEFLLISDLTLGWRVTEKEGSDEKSIERNLGMLREVIISLMTSGQIPDHLVRRCLVDPLRRSIITCNYTTANTQTTSSRRRIGRPRRPSIFWTQVRGMTWL